MLDVVLEVFAALFLLSMLLSFFAYIKLYKTYEAPPSEKDEEVDIEV